MVVTVVFTVRVTLNTIGSCACSAPEASVAATVMIGVSLSAIVPVANVEAPTV